MTRSALALAALVALTAPALAAKYDPDADRQALRAAATACYDATMRATGLSLEPEKIADIKNGLDEAARQGQSAEDAAKSLETAAALRADDMTLALKGRSGPAPDAVAKTFGDAAAAQRARWKTLTDQRLALKSQVDALPERTRDDKPNRLKRELKEQLEAAASDEAEADGMLRDAEAAAATMTDGAAKMKEAQKRSLDPGADRARNSAEVIRLADAFPGQVNEAKGRVDRLGTEPRAENKTRAWEKLDPLRDRSRELWAAADRACNRADEYHARSNDFDRAETAFTTARKGSDGLPGSARTLLDRAEGRQNEVRADLEESRKGP